jgi:hypothetical protein
MGSEVRQQQRSPEAHKVRGAGAENYGAPFTDTKTPSATAFGVQLT